jgi:hypothetical protein
MTQDQILLFSLFGGVFGLLLWGGSATTWWRSARFCSPWCSASCPADGRLSGFGHPAVVVVALVW